LSPWLLRAATPKTNISDDALPSEEQFNQKSLAIPLPSFLLSLADAFISWQETQDPDHPCHWPDRFLPAEN
jgi:hypothetical protein